MLDASPTSATTKIATAGITSNGESPERLKSSGTTSLPISTEVSSREPGVAREHRIPRRCVVTSAFDVSPTFNSGERTFVASFSTKGLGYVPTALQRVAIYLMANPDVALVGLWNNASGRGAEELQVVFVGPADAFPSDTTASPSEAS